MTEPLSPGGSTVRSVTEVRREGAVPLWEQPDWRRRFPWLVQGTTGRGEEEDPFDLGVFGAVPTGTLMDRWRRLLAATEMKTGIHSRQVHEARIAEWFDPLPPGLVQVEAYDAHLTDLKGLLLSVSVADCVPVFLVSEEPRAIAMVHAGWRGVAASIVERTIERMTQRTGGSADAFWLHCGPSICGICYEVGPEVHAGVNPAEPPPAEPTPIDLRLAIARRAGSRGLDPAKMTVSSHCTLCGAGDFFSHRGGSPARQMGVLGRRD